MNDNDLEHLLSTLDVAVDAIAICEVERGAWLVIEPSSSVEVHYVLAGTMCLTLSNSKLLVCEAGSLVVVPSGTSQIVAADGNPGREVRGTDCCSSTDSGFQLYDAASEPGDLRLFCGVIASGVSRTFGLLDRMSEPIITDLSDTPIVRQAFVAMLNEIRSPSLGTRALVGMLMKICLVKAMQGHLTAPKNRKSLLAWLRAPHLQKVVAEVRAKPGAAYDLVTLAAISGMSRSAFASEFLKTYGMTPMRFVTLTRLRRAAELLRSTPMPIKMVAGIVGFASRSHFSHAFRALYGIDPLNFRATSGSASPIFRD